MLTLSSPANVEAATLFKDNKQEYERRVKVSRAETGVGVGVYRWLIPSLPR